METNIIAGGQMNINISPRFYDCFIALNIAKININIRPIFQVDSLSVFKNILTTTRWEI